MRLNIYEVKERYASNIYKAAFSIVRDHFDAEDVLQETLISYLHEKKEFDSDEHIKAWLLKTAINKAKNIRLSFWKRNRVSLETYMENIPFAQPQDRDLFAALMKLPESNRIVLHLFYYEGYSVKEISNILRISEGTVKSRMARGKEKLRKRITEEWEDE
ncbi:MAG: RNA polymerase sigma factor [Solobacterium sp.]|nr:RNA polymerase sigma factor [Solobacterium sp.]